MTTINDFGIPITGLEGTDVLQPLPGNNSKMYFSCLSREDNDFLNTKIKWLGKPILIFNELQINFCWDDPHDPPTRQRFFNLLKSIEGQNTDMFGAVHLYKNCSADHGFCYLNYVGMTHECNSKREEYSDTKAYYYKVIFNFVKYEKHLLYGNRDSIRQPV